MGKVVDDATAPDKLKARVAWNSSWTNRQTNCSCDKRCWTCFKESWTSGTTRIATRKRETELRRLQLATCSLEQEMATSYIYRGKVIRFGGAWWPPLLLSRIWKQQLRYRREAVQWSGGRICYQGKIEIKFIAWKLNRQKGNIETIGELARDKYILLQQRVALQTNEFVFWEWPARSLDLNIVIKIDWEGGG